MRLEGEWDSFGQYNTTYSRGNTCTGDRSRGAEANDLVSSGKFNLTCKCTLMVSLKNII